MKSKLFIASSVEGLSVAYTIQSNLRHDVDATAWPQGVFSLSETPLDSLVDALDNSDFGVFVFNPDDVTLMRGENRNVVRDNVLFELGMFIGKLGKRRCFVVTPNDSDIYLPSDLWGFSTAKYDAEREDLAGSLGPACHEIRLSIKKHGCIEKRADTQKHIPINTFDNYDHTDKIALLKSWVSSLNSGTAIKLRDIDEKLGLEAGTAKSLLPSIFSGLNNFNIEQVGENIIRFKYTKPRPKRKFATSGGF